MNIEFRTVYDSISNEKYGQLYAKHCIDKQLKQLKMMKYLILFICLLGLAFSIYIDLVKGIFVPYILFVIMGVVTSIYCERVKKKLYPKLFSEINGVGCPFSVTYGLYDEYIYEKFENNMSIYESSVRYEFLKKVVETPDCFVIMTKRSGIYFLPKCDMGYENALGFSEFCKSRLPYIYKVAN